MDDRIAGSIPVYSVFPFLKLIEYNESPLFLQLSPGASSLSRAKAGGELPIAIYETHVEMPDAQSTAASGPAVFFRPASYHVETGEAERIAVDHTSKPPDAEGDAQSSLIASFTTQYNAIKMLSDRIKMLVDYVHSVQEQKIPKDDETLRQISSLVAGLPASGELEEFRQEFLTEYNDLLLTSYLANMTSGLNSLNEVSLCSAGTRPRRRAS
jgi:COP9 signalosome complex subunit 6